MSYFPTEMCPLINETRRKTGLRRKYKNVSNPTSEGKSNKSLLCVHNQDLAIVQVSQETTENSMICAFFEILFKWVWNGV